MSPCLAISVHLLPTQEPWSSFSVKSSQHHSAQPSYARAHRAAFLPLLSHGIPAQKPSRGSLPVTHKEAHTPLGH